MFLGLVGSGDFSMTTLALQGGEWGQAFHYALPKSLCNTGPCPENYGVP